MIELGEYNYLEISRKTDHGLYLIDEEENEVLLPNKYVPEDYRIGDKMRVFIYLDHDERDTATTLQPLLTLYKFAFLEVMSTTEYGAFLDWGLQKQLFVPFREQREKMEVGEKHIVRLDWDEETERLYGSARADRYLSNQELSVKEGDQVEVLVHRKSDLGWSVIVNHEHKGLVYANELFEEINVGDLKKGFVTKVRDENKLDISLYNPNTKVFTDENSGLVMDKLADGLELSDQSRPEDIYKELGVSKKAFKKATGALYKAKKIAKDQDGYWRLRE